MVRKALLSSVALATFASLAAAADLPSRAPPAPYIPPAPIFTWTGFYLGPLVGGAWNDKRWLFPGPGTRTSHTDSSVIVGGQVGFNYQISSIVLGVQGDAAWTGLSGRSICPNPAAVCRTDEDWIGSVTGRLGFAFGQALIYGKGGVAFTNDTYLVSFPAAPAFNERNSGGGDRTGWTIGGGIEYAFWGKWSGFAEYDHYDFGTAKFNMNRITTGAFVERLNVAQTADVVKVGLNYRFW